MSELPPPSAPGAHPQGQWSAPSTSPTPPASPASTSVPLGVLGAFLTLVSIASPWTSSELWDKERSAIDLTSQIIFDDTPADLSSFPLAIPLAAVVVMMFVGAVKANLRALLVIGALAALAIPLLYLSTTSSLVDRYNPSLSTLSSVGFGTWLCLAGGGLALIGAITARRRVGAPAA